MVFAGYWKWLCNREHSRACAFWPQVGSLVSYELLIVTESEEILIDQESGREPVQMKGILFHVIQCLRFNLAHPLSLYEEVLQVYAELLSLVESFELIFRSIIENLK